MLGIEGNPSTAYHPQMDGQTEQMNREVEKYLQTYINYQQDNWSEWLPLAEFTYNNAVHEATHQTPFFLNKGCHPRVHPFNQIETMNLAVAEYKNLTRAWETSACFPTMT
jgi:hypothetical protein